MVRLTAIWSWPNIAAGIIGVAAFCVTAHAAQEPPHSAELDAMIVKEAKRHGVPERLVRRVIMRESRYNPRARNHSFWGLMQISYPTAKSMGFKGTPEQLLNPLVNLTYAVPYLANAFVIAGQHDDAAVRLYAHGYYYAARHRGLLGALRTADSPPAAGYQDPPAAPIVAAVEPPSGFGIFGALIGPSEAPAAAPQVASAEVAAPPQTQANPTPAPSRKSGGAKGETAAASELPKKWLHDGGVTVLARGEQSVDQIAAARQAAGTSRTSHLAAHHLHKNAEFASLDTPPSAAQAYAGSGGDVSAAPQVAINQAIAMPASAEARAGAAAATDPAPLAATGDAPDHGVVKRHSKATRKSRTIVAKADAKTAHVKKTDAKGPAANATDAVAQLRQ